STVPENDPARGPTAPMAIPRTGTKDGPPVARRSLTPVKGSGERLITTSEELGDAADRAFDDLSAEPAAKPTAGDGKLRPPARPAKLPLPAPIEEESEMTIEAEEPPTLEKRPGQISTKKPRAIGDQSEPEISIERFVELEVEEPMGENRDEGSAPEIMILQPGRAITADDSSSVGGTIDTEPETQPEPLKKKR
ncbi:MAG: hypothetical protein ABI678_22010, partial [Kofleriaceae bacterium]